MSANEAQLISVPLHPTILSFLIWIQANKKRCNDKYLHICLNEPKARHLHMNFIHSNKTEGAVSYLIYTLAAN